MKDRIAGFVVKNPEMIPVMVGLGIGAIGGVIFIAGLMIEDPVMKQKIQDTAVILGCVEVGLGSMMTLMASHGLLPVPSRRNR